MLILKTLLLNVLLTLLLISVCTRVLLLYTTHTLDATRRCPLGRAPPSPVNDIQDTTEPSRASVFDNL